MNPKIRPEAQSGRVYRFTWGHFRIEEEGSVPRFPQTAPQNIVVPESELGTFAKVSVMSHDAEST